jgi:hypothetical protein
MTRLHVPTLIRTRLRSLATIVAAVASLVVASIARGHDFWLIPDMFGFPNDANVHVNGRSGLQFPTGTPIQPVRVADARIIGATSTTKITEMAVEGTSLRLHSKPSAPGQYLIVAGLMSRRTRTTPAGLIRYLRAEGGAAEAARLEKENTLGSDTVVYTGASYAATILQLGNSGPRAFSKTAGFPLEFVPVNDPLRVNVGDTLHFKVLGGGKAVPNIGIDATPAADTTAGANTTTMVSLNADANGVVHLPLTKAGPWMLRSAHVARTSGGAPNEWDVSRSTYVFNVGPKK